MIGSETHPKYTSRTENNYGAVGVRVAWLRRVHPDRTQNQMLSINNELGLKVVCFSGAYHPDYVIVDSPPLLDGLSR